eukprot:1178491-Prorocentrum_minimum.AAC.2
MPSVRRLSLSSLFTTGPASFWLTRSCMQRGVGIILSLIFWGLVSTRQHVMLLPEVNPELTAPQGLVQNPVFSLIGLGSKQMEMVVWIGFFLSVLQAISAFNWFLLPMLLWVIMVSLAAIESPLFGQQRCITPVRT